MASVECAKAKVLLVSPAVDVGGAEAYLYAYAAYLIEKGHTVALAMAENLLGGKQGQALESLGVRLIPCDIGWSWSDDDWRRNDAYKAKINRQRHQMRSLLETVVPDRVFLNLNWASFGLGLMLALAELPVRGAALFHLTPHVLDVAAVEQRFYGKLATQGFCMFAVSNDTRLNTSSTLGVSCQAIRTVLNTPVIPTDLQAKTRDEIRTDVRREFDIPDAARILLFAGRLDVQKGVKENLPALVQIVQRHPDLYVLLCGGGPYAATIEFDLTRLNVADRIILTGYRSDVTRLMAGADVFLLPSRYEGRCLALLEALALGCTVVASDIAPNREVVTDGVNGYLAPVGHWRAMASVIEHAVAHPLSQKNSSEEAPPPMFDTITDQLLRNDQSWMIDVDALRSAADNLACYYQLGA